mmetsp:Transcript_42777/g.69551  ORF Transcript_42777/g.69551 Transcript_42777/m.69551 type:complete len:277 (-) Transcript_42777:77-907(-)
MPTAVVTGGSSGIGAGLCENLLSSGWKVCLLARSRDKMEKLAARYPAELSFVQVCDLSKVNQIEPACRKIMKWCNGRLNLLVNNAGMGKIDCTTESTSMEDFQLQITVNLTAVFALTKYLLPALKQEAKFSRNIGDSHGATVIHIGSIASFAAFPKLTPYCVAKAGVAHLTRIQSMEFAPHQIRVNCIQPATVITDWHNRAGMGKEKAARYYTNSHSAHPIGRSGTVEDIVQMTNFLADKRKSGWITGQCLTMDGGRMLKASLPSTKAQDGLRSKL